MLHTPNDLTTPRFSRLHQLKDSNNTDWSVLAKSSKEHDVCKTVISIHFFFMLCVSEYENIRFYTMFQANSKQ